MENLILLLQPIQALLQKRLGSLQLEGSLYQIIVRLHFSFQLLQAEIDQLRAGHYPRQ